MKYKVGIIGVGFCGSACEIGFERVPNTEVKTYDKYKNTDSLETVVDFADMLFICLPTPMLEGGKCDISIIGEVCDRINSIATKSKTIIIKSTVPPGTTQNLQQLYPEHLFVFNPEFLTEKNFINDFLEQDRILLGCDFLHIDKFIKMYDNLVNFYGEFTKKQKVPAKIYRSTTKCCEMTKYMANCLLAAKVIFCNEMYEICEKSGINYEEVRQMVCLDRRIGNSHTKVPYNGDFAFGRKMFSKRFEFTDIFCKKYRC